MKLKIFEDNNPDKLEKKVNLWLSSYSDEILKVLDKQVTNFYYDAEAYTQIVIWYQELR